MKMYFVLQHDTFCKHSQMNFSIGSISTFPTAGLAKLYQKITMKLTNKQTKKNAINKTLFFQLFRKSHSEIFHETDIP